MVVFLGLILLALTGFAALATDVGLLLVERRQLQNTVDAAALAGAQEFLQSGWTQTDVGAAVEQWAEHNQVQAYELSEISLGTKTLPIGTLPTVTVVAERDVSLLFAGVFGRDSMKVSVRATAGVAPLRPTKIWPWALSEANYYLLLQEQMQHGEVVLKEGAQGGQQGNRLPLALGGTGSTVYEDNIKYGYNGPVPHQVPPNLWTVETEPGNMAGPTEDGVDYLLDLEQANPCGIARDDLRCPLIGLVPVITDASWDAANGRAPVDVMQFTIFKITGLRSENGKGGKGHKQVVGEFVTSATAVGPTDTGSLTAVFGLRLWE
jgi:hypothetical protein